MTHQNLNVAKIAKAGSMALQHRKPFVLKWNKDFWEIHFKKYIMKVKE